MALKKEDHRSLKPRENVIADPTHLQMGRSMKDCHEEHHSTCIIDCGMEKTALA